MRSRLPLLLTACFALPTFALGDTLQRSGPAEDRLDLVILGDGYRSTDRADFESDANRLWDQLRTTEPFTRYAGLMNVHTGFRASSIRGPGENNAYGTHFVTLFGTRLRATRMTLLLADAVRAGGEADAVIVLVNTNRRGGTAIGSVCFASSSAPRVGIHELGHVIGRLGDEYSSFSGTPSLTREQLARIYPNLTTASTRALTSPRCRPSASRTCTSPVTPTRATTCSIRTSVRSPRTSGRSIVTW